MSVDDQMRTSSRELARRALWRFAPAYARRRSSKSGLAATVRRLEADFAHVSKRHGEQIERLEELARELVATAESLRREIVARAPRNGD